MTRGSVRFRLTLLFASVFLVSGAGLLGITYGLVSHAQNGIVVARLNSGGVPAGGSGPADSGSPSTGAGGSASGGAIIGGPRPGGLDGVPSPGQAGAGFEQ